MKAIDNLKATHTLDDFLTSDDCLKAVGYTSKGKRLEFKINGYGLLSCSFHDLVSLNIPEGIKFIRCWNNKLTELNIPEGVIELYCSDNLLTELNIPSSVITIVCDRNVKGLDNIDWDCNIKLF